MSLFERAEARTSSNSETPDFICRSWYDVCRS